MTDRQQIIYRLSRAGWPDGGHDGFPTRVVAEMLADQVVIPLVLEAKRETLKAVADTLQALPTVEIEDPRNGTPIGERLENEADIWHALNRLRDDAGC